MFYSLSVIIAPFLPSLAILFSAMFNYYIIVKKRLSWQGILIANVVYLAVMTLFDFPAYDFLSEIVIFLVDLTFKIIEAIFDGLWSLIQKIAEFYKDYIIDGIIDIIVDIWDWLKGIFS